MNIIISMLNNNSFTFTIELKNVYIFSVFRKKKNHVFIKYNYK